MFSMHPHVVKRRGPADKGLADEELADEGSEGGGGGLEGAYVEG